MTFIGLAPSSSLEAPISSRPRFPTARWLSAGLLAVAACGLGCGEPAPTRGRVVGRVRFEGTVPEPETLDLSASPLCASLHDGPVLDRDVVVGPDGGLAQVLVRLVDPPPEPVPPAPSSPAVLALRDCRFDPQVLAIRVGQPLVVRNTDPTYHDVVAEPKINPGFDFSQPFEGMENRAVFEQPELGIEIRSRAQPWMRARLDVIAHPWFAITREDGAFALEPLPLGRYTLELRHPRLGTRRSEVTVEAGKTSEVEVVFDDAARETR